jgi:signal transduction histidine kinase/ActR/RegA family two-component response regulator
MSKQKVGQNLIGRSGSAAPGKPSMSGLRGITLAPPAKPSSAALGWALDLHHSSLAARQNRLDEAILVARRLTHDFNNILTGILGFSEMSMGLLGVGSPAYHYMAEVYRAAQQGGEFTQRLRWFTRRGPVECEANSLASAVHQEESRLRSECDSSVSLRFALPPSLPSIAVDGEALRQLLGQVLDNARDALLGKGTIALTASKVELTDAERSQLLGAAEPGPHVELVIADSGCGLSTEARQRLFAKPFYSSKPSHRGLGLAIVYGILRNSGGGFRIEDAPERGTIVRLYLPVAPCAPSTTVPASSTTPATKERLLVVDDDPGVLHLVCATLERAGYSVQPAPGGAEAMECFAAAGASGFNLIISDVVMPCINGVDLARRLIALDADVNVLFMSGHVSADFAQVEFADRPFDVLSKPFRPDGLLRAVRKALDRNSSLLPAAIGTEPVPNPVSN